MRKSFDNADKSFKKVQLDPIERDHYNSLIKIKKK